MAEEKKKQADVTANLVPIFIMGKKYEVPESLTIQKAMEYAGYLLIRGCGCRGGICGACGTIYRFPNDYKLHFGLACQTVVEPNMYLTQLPFFPANKSTYDRIILKSSPRTLIRSLKYIRKFISAWDATHALKAVPWISKLWNICLPRFAVILKKQPSFPLTV